MKKFFLGLVALCSVVATAQAMPTRDEAYRSDRLGTIVYKDSQDPSIFWYLPPLRLYENDGKVVFYRRPKGQKVEYYFYVQPYMTDDLIDLLAGEVPNLQNRSQLRPVTASQFGIKVKQFDTVAMGDKITDYHYLNQPQLIKMSLDASNADDFDFFVQNKPGIQADVLFSYETERMDKYLNIELSYKEVYNALNIGATGKYTFTKAEISSAMENYVGHKYFQVKSKGDIPIPEIVNKVIEECFTPYRRASGPSGSSGHRTWEDWIQAPDTPEVHEAVQKQLDLLNGLAGSAWDPGDDSPWGGSTGSSGSSGSSGSAGGGGSNGGGSGLGAGDASLQFTFKKEYANSEKTFYYSQQHFVDSTETASMPLYLSLQPTGAASRVAVTPLGRKEFVVEYSNSSSRAFSSGVNVEAGQQYIITAAFALSARSAYDSNLNWYRWQSNWPSVDEDLYYRIGTGPWNKVGGRTVIKTDSIFHGALQFYLDREHIWSKIPSDYKDPKMLGFVPAIFTFQKTYPQFNVVVTGRQVQVNP